MPKVKYLAKKLVCPVCEQRTLRTQPKAGYLHFTCPCGYSDTDTPATVSLLARVQQDTQIDATIPVPYVIKLSDPAWDHLSRVARDYEWVRSINTVTAPGAGTYHINRFLMALSTVQTWHDMRPLTYQGSGLWYDGGPLLRHDIHLSPASITGLAEIAYTHKIPPRNVQSLILNETYRASAPTPVQYTLLQSRCSETTFATAVLEAAGLRYLRPEAWPLAPPDLYKHKKGHGHPRTDPLAVYTQKLYG